MDLRSELLLSLPPNMCRQLRDCHADVAERAFVTHDPPSEQLGSGGGTAHVMAEAWRESAEGSGSFLDWVKQRQRIILHGGGESRRLPAYAGVGKLFIPMPVLRWSRGQRLGQTLLDLNEPFLREAFRRSGPSARMMIASGDVMLRSSTPIPKLPDVDVMLLGMWAAPEVAQNYGVLFCDRNDPTQLSSFLQKPTPDEIRDRSRDMPFLIDVGVWLLSARAVACLMSKCGWDESKNTFENDNVPHNYDLYGQWSQHLGSDPLVADKDVSELSVAVAPIDAGEFYHFGTTSDVIESMYSLQNIVTDQSQLGAVSSLAQPKQFIQDSFFGGPLRRQENDALWVEGCHIPDTWKIGMRHMLTGVPKNEWHLQLTDGICLDFVPLGDLELGDSEVAIRPYGFSDRFRGPLSSRSTLWMERPARDWFSNRQLDFSDANISPDTDLQKAALFPVLKLTDLNEGFVQWLIAIDPSGLGDRADEYRKTWLQSRRLSARQLSQDADLKNLHESRRQNRLDALPVMVGHGRRSIFCKLDLASVAADYAVSGHPLPDEDDVEQESDLMMSVHDRMFRSEVLRLRQDDQWQSEQDAAFGLLKQAIVAPYQDSPVVPANQLANDQIVWARSPARVDFAGGWTDTSPYCIEQGGRVVNIALNLNGQPPIQAFARCCEKKTITIRSIDLGISEEITRYEQLVNDGAVGGGFSVAKAALCLSGFHPDYNGGKYDSLADQLEYFGGGVDLSMLAAIPKGSGLGTSSILAGTVLGALSELAGFSWDVQTLAERVTAVEQILGSGGGWQDQMGGMLPGAKFIETQPGMSQKTAVRWLPKDFFESPEYKSRTLLYYTGITRVAHNVLGQIVRGVFLNDPQRLGVLSGIARNAQDCFDAVQRLDLDAFAGSVDQSWQLNQSLDCGTNPPEVSSIIQRIRPYVCAVKLAGAGGGGFMYLIAKDVDQAQRLREDLESRPPNSRARFVDMSLSTTGLQVTRS